MNIKSKLGKKIAASVLKKLEKELSEIGKRKTESTLKLNVFNSGIVVDIESAKRIIADFSARQIRREIGRITKKR